jgi:hypothetical protein
MKWRPLVCFQAAGLTKIVASKAIGALDLHWTGAHGTLWGPGQTLHL